MTGTLGYTKDAQTKVPFELKSFFNPTGDQPKAIEQLLDGLKHHPHQTLLGVTGSGKTFTMANVIQKLGRPTLVLAHNKTLVAQLYQELKAFFPHNAVEYFVSYYDYYQPEAYVPSTDTYIEKDSQINETIDRMRHRATRSLLSRNDAIIVASVSCIYGIGGSESYQEMTVYLEVGQSILREAFLRRLIESQYERNDIAFSRSTFRVRGDVVDVFPAHEEDLAIRVTFFGDQIEKIQLLDPLRGKILENMTHVVLFPASHYATTKERLQRAIELIKNDLDIQLQALKSENKLLEYQRLKERTLYDIEMLETTGVCKGIENYSRYLTGRSAGEPPPTLLDYFPKDFLMVVDESHQTLPQVQGMYRGDRSRKETLVNFGFRLPSALDNRPLQFGEFESRMHEVIYVSATPGTYELEKSQGIVVEQLIRPTGLLDPVLEVRPIKTQVDDMIHECKVRIQKKQRVLITTLTKRMAEDLTEYLQEVNIKAKYLHSDIDTIERLEILRQLRLGECDVIIGINLLREGLDLPEVSLVGILDADKEGFLRSATGLIQTIGRAARNADGMAILYADRITDSMKKAIDETKRRREIQEAYNQTHGITPTTIIKAIHDIGMDEGVTASTQEVKISKKLSPKELEKEIKKLKKTMLSHAKKMEFEEAAKARDQLHLLEKQLFELQ